MLYLKVDVPMATSNKTIKLILEIVKLVASALLGYLGGSAVM